MRRSLVFLVVLFLGAPAQAGTTCDAAPSHGPVGLADTVFVKGVCGTFALRRNGSIGAVQPPAWAPQWAADALARADARTYITHRGRRLGLLEDGRVLWRSRLAHGSDNVVLHGDAIAFTAYKHMQPQPELWVARIGQAERLAARGEDLLGWARAGGFFTQYRRELRLRTSGGRLARRLGLVRGTAYDARTGSLFALTHEGVLFRTDGRTTAMLRATHAERDAWLQVLPYGLILLVSTERLLVLRGDGTLFAVTSLTGRDLVSAVQVLPRVRGVVFVLETGVTETVELLERGRRSARVVYRRRGRPRGCAYWVALSQRGNALLYRPSAGHTLVALDALGRRPPVDLWPTVSRTPGFRHGGRIIRAAWASAWNT